MPRILALFANFHQCFVTDSTVPGFHMPPLRGFGLIVSFRTFGQDVVLVLWQLLFDYGEGTGHFVHDCWEVGREERLLGINYHVGRNIYRRMR